MDWGAALGKAHFSAENGRQDRYACGLARGRSQAGWAVSPGPPMIPRLLRSSTEGLRRAK